MIWFVSTLLAVIIITYITWLALQAVINNLLNLTGNSQILINKILEKTIDISKIMPGMAQQIEKLNGATNEMITEVIKELNNWTDKIQKLANIIIIVIPVAGLLFLISIYLKMIWLTIFLAIIFLLSGFWLLETYSTITDTITHARFRRSTRPLALLTAYFFNLSIVCAYWFFVDYDTFITALTTLSIWMLILIGFGFSGHYFLEKRKNGDDKEGWYTRESNAAGKALWFSAIVFILVLILIKFTGTSTGSVITGTIKATSKVALKKVDILRGKISGIPGYTTQKTKLYILIGKPGGRKLVPLLNDIPANYPLIFPDSLKTTITGSLGNGKKIKLVRVIVNGEEGFIPELDIKTGFPSPPSSIPTRTSSSVKSPTTKSTIKKHIKKRSTSNNIPPTLTHPLKIEWDKEEPLITPFQTKVGQRYVIKTLSGKPFLIKLTDKNGNNEGWHKRESGRRFRCVDYSDVIIVKKTIPGKETFIFIPIS